jgi:Mce-associated membrane protein
MAADADAPDGALSKTAGKAPSPASPDTEDGSSVSPEDIESTTAAEPEAADGDTDEAVENESAAEDRGDEAAVDDEVDDASEDAAPVESASHVRLAAIVGLAIVIALAASVGWLGFRAYQSHQAETQRQLFLQVGRQCALNLTTIDWQHAEADVQRVLDSATGQFYDQFSKRKQPFIEVIKKAQSKSVGTITEAGVESESGDKAQVLVAVSIKTTNLGAADQPLREWRMRISVEKSGNEAKISNVAFVP